jgi:hypothetical protein
MGLLFNPTGPFLNRCLARFYPGVDKAWLASGGSTENAQNTRAYAVRKIEQQLNALGFSPPDLEAAYAEDGFAAIRAKLGAMRQDAKAGGEEFRILMPDLKSLRTGCRAGPCG